MKKEQVITYEGIEKTINKFFDNSLIAKFNEFEIKLDKKADKGFAELDSRLGHIEEKIILQGQDLERHVSGVYEKFQEDLAVSLEGSSQFSDDITRLKDDVSELKHDMRSIKAVLGVKTSIYRD